MQIRIMGTREECDILLATMSKEFLLEVSPYYPNRGNSKLVRCYITTNIKADAYEKANQIEKAIDRMTPEQKEKYLETLEILLGHYEGNKKID